LSRNLGIKSVSHVSLGSTRCHPKILGVWRLVSRQLTDE
jgi:hypothetical protein